MNRFERPKTAQEAVLLEIRERLFDGRVKPGDAIRPDAIAEQLGVSAVPVREALRILEGEGHVSYRPHRGYLVTELDIDDLREIHRLRELLEAEAVQCGLPKLQADDLEQMRDAIREMESNRDNIPRVKAANRQFHFALINAANMPHLNRMISWLWDASEPYCSLFFMLPENRDRVDEEHRRIVELAEAGDVDATIKELNAHRKNAFAVLEQGLSTVGSSDA